MTLQKRIYVQGTTKERLLAHSMPEPNTGCWLWTSTVGSHGYGSLTMRGTVKLAHRLSYEEHKETIPDGMQIDHLCGVKLCINPEHLEPVTMQENLRRSPRSNHSKTHCKRGHPFDAVNTYRRKNGSRLCRTCTLEAQRVKRNAG